MKIKNIYAVIFLFVGVFVLGFWTSGSHGHVVFRPHMLEDWIMGGLVLLAFGLSFFFIRKDYV